MGEWKRDSIAPTLCNIVAGSTPSTSENRFWNGSNIWITPNDLSKLSGKDISDSDRKITDLGVKNSTGKLIPANSVVISCRAPVGYCAVATKLFATNQGCKSLICYNIDADYLYYYLLKSTKELERFSSGTTFLELPKKELQRFEIHYPSSKDEQAKIAEVLETVDGAIAKTKALIDKYSNIKLGMMQDFFNNIVTTQKLVDFCDSVRDGTHDSPKPTRSSGKYLITSKHLGNQNLDFSCAYKISFEDYQQIIRRSKVDKWDILFSMIGTIGSIYQETKDNPDYAVKNVGLFKMGGNAQKSQWLKYYLQSNLCKKYLSLSLRGSTQKYVSLDVLRKMPIYVPSSDEQQDIINQLEAIDIKITTETNYLSKLQDIKQGLMQDLLKPDGISVDTLL